jgi:hypothetical protein
MYKEIFIQLQKNKEPLVTLLKIFWRIINNTKTYFTKVQNA